MSRHDLRSDAYCLSPLSGPAHIGERVSFIPSCFVRAQESCYLQVETVLHGQVIYVNADHRYYTVEAPCFGYKVRESFKF